MRKFYKLYRWFFVQSLQLSPTLFPINKFFRPLGLFSYIQNTNLQIVNFNKKLLTCDLPILEYILSKLALVRPNYWRFSLPILAYLPQIQLFFRFCQNDGFLYIRNLGIVLFIDSLLIDDEPLWEPLEWSLVQTWILFIFIFAWVAENLIVSRFW